MSSTEALKAGLRGKALKIGHYYRDTLWESAENCGVPNAGFYEDVVFPNPALVSASHASDSCQDDPLVIEGTDVNNTPSALEESAVSNEAGEQVNVAMANMQITENASVAESNVDQQIPLSVEEVDALLDTCLLQALHTTVKDLPMPGSTLW